MADSSRPDNFDSQPESSGNSNDDFEKLDAPSSGFYSDGGEADGPNAAVDAGAYDYDFDHKQESEISSTTHMGGEEEAEEDRYNAGASEADNYAHSSEPLISIGDDDPFQVQAIQPSAPPVSEISPPEPLIDFDNSTGPDNDILASFASSTLPSSKIQESISANTVESQKEISKEVTEQNEETSKDKEINVTSTTESLPSQHTGLKKLSSGDSRIPKESGNDSPLEKTQIYKTLMSLGSWLKGVDPRGETEAAGAKSSACTDRCFCELKSSRFILNSIMTSPSVYFKIVQGFKMKGKLRRKENEILSPFAFTRCHAGVFRRTDRECDAIVCNVRFISL
ncbi:hypothetical protein RRG08_033694 [Elysia crispata]|uniref:Uncharacterized protein n=1 Tax=Elysia crispata TaxID=231223 RepID=A0AAE1DV37_9GAST|nr:hypothetical protein RRG08_033694 [Elysia crispata]